LLSDPIYDEVKFVAWQRSVSRPRSATASGQAISNGRLLNFEDGFVYLWYRDYARGSQKRVMTLRGLEFVRRQVPHVLSRGFVQILRYGRLWNRQRREHRALCRQLLADFIVAGSRKQGSSVNQQEQASIRK
jgi:hypothetical protein